MIIYYEGGGHGRDRANGASVHGVGDASAKARPRLAHPLPTVRHATLLDPIVTESATPEHAPRILIVDDHTDTRVILRHYFEAMGFAVDEAEDGQQALARLQERRPAVLVLDIQMPHLDGIGVLRVIRADDALRDLPVLALSAHAMSEEVREISAAGADAYLSKPAHPKDVVSAVRTLIASR